MHKLKDYRKTLVSPFIYVTRERRKASVIRQSDVGIHSNNYEQLSETRRRDIIISSMQHLCGYSTWHLSP